MASPSGPFLVAQKRFPSGVGEKGEEFLVELPTGKMLGRNWLVFWRAPRIHEPSPVPNPRPVGSTDAFLGSPPPSAGGRVAQATGAPGARRRGCAGQRPRRPQRMEGSSFPSQRPLPGGSSPERPPWASPGGRTHGLGPVLRSMSLRLPGSAARREIRTGDPLFESSGDERPTSSLQSGHSRCK